jgi:hypothetical protein
MSCFRYLHWNDVFVLRIFWCYFKCRFYSNQLNRCGMRLAYVQTTTTRWGSRMKTCDTIRYWSALSLPLSLSLSHTRSLWIWISLFLFLVLTTNYTNFVKTPSLYDIHSDILNYVWMGYIKRWVSRQYFLLYV